MFEYQFQDCRMKYIKVEKYIVSLDCIHGVLHDYPSDQAVKDGCMPYQRILVSYNGSPMVTLEFKTIEDSQKAFDKIAEALGGC